jgi:hypothetical protein
MVRHFGVMVAKVQAGFCCMPNCSEKAQLVVHSQDRPPVLCRKHQNDGSDTHYGEWVSVPGKYFEAWSCCDTNWKLCSCRKLVDLFDSVEGIPVTEEQKKNAQDEADRLTAQQEENERWERMINAGRDEAYDR